MPVSPDLDIVFIIIFYVGNCITSNFLITTEGFSIRGRHDFLLISSFKINSAKNAGSVIFGKCSSIIALGAKMG